MVQQPSELTKTDLNKLIDLTKSHKEKPIKI